MTRLLLFVLFTGLTGCASQPVRLKLRAPDPGGCYLIVYERQDYQGAGEVFNGPMRLTSLERLPYATADNWHNRIRSVRVGNAAAVTVYVNANLTGDSGQFGPATQQPRLDAALSGQIESLEVTCRQLGAATQQREVLLNARALLSR